ncbi:MAG: 23S rRNA (pseudouridine(1915)-N(3))-methyltransferase RlmH [Thermodesulfovibrionales bacterium]|nr:23S rRNA (pseudouridine(1915)-N(3))-methyltransferase RlmH [Thermodesulfovibrionales bacterium]
MKIKVFWVGRTKERYLVDGINRYFNLIRHMAQIEMMEIKEDKGKTLENALITEGKRILRQTGQYVLLDEKGRELDSNEFAMFLRDYLEKGGIDFVMGGPYGVSDEVRENANCTIALSKMTFTHEMVRLIFLEQLYRAMTIIKDRRYHH